MKSYLKVYQLDGFLLASLVFLISPFLMFISLFLILINSWRLSSTFQVYNRAYHFNNHVCKLVCRFMEAILDGIYYFLLLFKFFNSQILIFIFFQNSINDFKKFGMETIITFMSNILPLRSSRLVSWVYRLELRKKIFYAHRNFRNF